MRIILSMAITKSLQKTLFFYRKHLTKIAALSILYTSATNAHKVNVSWENIMRNLCNLSDNEIDAIEDFIRVENQDLANNFVKLADSLRITPMQSAQALDYRETKLTPIILSDSGTSIRIIFPDGSFNMIDIDFDFSPFIDSNEQSAGEYIFKKLRKS